MHHGVKFDGENNVAGYVRIRLKIGYIILKKASRHTQLLFQLMHFFYLRDSVINKMLCSYYRRRLSYLQSNFWELNWFGEKI